MNKDLIPPKRWFGLFEPRVPDYRRAHTILVKTKECLALAPEDRCRESPKQVFICYAIESAAGDGLHPTASALCRLIEHRLNGIGTYDSWLKEMRGITFNFHHIQHLRHEWLNALIEEFKP